LNGNFNSPAFKDALIDYYYFLAKNYPGKDTLKLVGNRYRLSRVQRIFLFRGITSKNSALLRKAKQIPLENLAGNPLYIDGYNVLFGVMNYLLGKPVFIGNDGILRDSGGVYGKIENQGLFDKAVHLLVEFVRRRNIENFTLYLDQPVAGSNSHKEAIEKKMQQEKVKGEIRLAPFVDHCLKQKNDGVIATSDSEIIDATPCKILDLAWYILKNAYDITVLDLGSLIAEGEW
jgi:hypothetical protein